MKLLFVTNFYPPINAGGYDQLCGEVAQKLSERGHDLTVFTSNYQAEKAPLVERKVNRKLYLETDPYHYSTFDFFFNRNRRLTNNLEFLERAIKEHSPDFVVLWSLWAFSKSLAAMIEKKMPEQTAYYLAGYWPVTENIHCVYWKTPARHRLFRWPKRIGSFFALRMIDSIERSQLKFRNVMCVSLALRDILVSEGVPIEDARIIYNGIDIDNFKPMKIDDPSNSPIDTLKLLYAGQIAHHKGVHTAVKAIDHLVNKLENRNVQLTIVGSGHPDYIKSLQKLISEGNLGLQIEIKDRIAREKMPDLLREFHGLILPSIFAEPLARIAQEAMASGLVVISTLTGGMKELLIDGENGLAFEPEDSEGLAVQIDRIYRDKQLATRLIQSGRKTIVEKFSILRMVDEFEDYLIDLAKLAKIQ